VDAVSAAAMDGDAAVPRRRGCGCYGDATAAAADDVPAAALHALPPPPTVSTTIATATTTTAVSDSGIER